MPVDTRVMEPTAMPGEQPRRVGYVTQADLGVKNIKDWPSYEAIQVSLAQAGESGPANTVQHDEAGRPFRLVPVNEGTREREDGTLEYLVRPVRRYVALSLSDAQKKSLHPDERLGRREWDHWNGWTWIRRGLKPERDLITLVQQRLDAQKEPLQFEAAPEADQIEHQNIRARAEARKRKAG